MAKASRMRLRPFGPDGAPGETALDIDGSCVVAVARDHDALPLLTAAHATLEYAFIADEGQIRRLLAAFAGRQFLQEYIEEQTALAVWDDDGGYREY